MYGQKKKEATSKFFNHLYSKAGYKFILNLGLLKLSSKPIN